MPQVFIRTIPLPYTVHGLVTPNDELAHISGDHLYDDRPVEELEAEADEARAIPLFHISA